MKAKFDVVVFRTQETIRGTITQETLTHVTVKTRNGSERTIPKDLVISIRHKDLNY